MKYKNLGTIGKVFFNIFIMSLIFFPVGTYAQKKGIENPNNLVKPKPKVFPDQYSELDDKKPKKGELDDEVKTTIEHARQKYIRGLILIQRGDTLACAKQFEEALDNLNKIVSNPGVETNEEFTDLAQSIIEDYETYIKNTDYLDENSSVFIIRELIFKEIENFDDSKSKKKVQTTENIAKNSTKPKDTKHKLLPWRSKMPEKLSIDLPDNDDVQHSIDFLSNGKGRKFFSRWLERSTKYFPMILRIAESEGMPPEISFLAMIESGVNPNAVSSAKAVGLWQFIRSTGELYGLNSDNSLWVDERRDPEKATRASMRHLKDLYNMFGDWHLALAAYNCGAGCVQRAINKSGLSNPDYWAIRNRLPRETKYYVPQFVAAAKMALNPEEYGFQLDTMTFQQEYRYDVVPITEPVNLNALAKAANITPEELHELNPELLRNITPPDRKAYYLKIPYNTINQFKVNYAALTPDEKAPFVTHVVRHRESIESIARMYKVSKNELAAINDLSGKRIRLKTGTKLMIPVGSKMDQADLASDDSNASNDTTSKNQTIAENITHRVQRGETLYSIARKYGVEVGEIRKLNNFTSDDNIRAGEEITITQKVALKNAPEKQNLAVQSTKKNSSTANSEVKVVKHKVKRGETLAQIADEYNVSIINIKTTNKLRSNSVKKGQVLKIEINEAVASAIEPEQKPVIHKVRRGENISTIAARYGVTEDQLKEWNEKSIEGNTIFANSRLKIYPSNDSKGSAQPKSKDIKVSPKYYRVQSGDTLYEISKKFGVSMDQLIAKNKHIKADRLNIGDKIRIQ